MNIIKFSIVERRPIIILKMGLFKKGKGIELKTVLLQGHFYSLHLLFASANKTTFQARMIQRTPIFITGKIGVIFSKILTRMIILCWIVFGHSDSVRVWVLMTSLLIKQKKYHHCIVFSRFKFTLIIFFFDNSLTFSNGFSL